MRSHEAAPAVLAPSTSISDRVVCALQLCLCNPFELEASRHPAHADMMATQCRRFQTFRTLLLEAALWWAGLIARGSARVLARALLWHN